MCEPTCGATPKRWIFWKPMSEPNHADIDPCAVEVLDFWFGRPGDAHYCCRRAEAWFRKDEAFDALDRTALRHADRRGAARRVGALGGAAAVGAGADRSCSTSSRATPAATRRGMFAGDAQALAAARAMCARRRPQLARACSASSSTCPSSMPRTWRCRTSANRCACSRSSGATTRRWPACVEWAQKHHDIVARFGRFPHRNAALSRSLDGRGDRVPEAAGLRLLTMDRARRGRR